jgi:cellulose synthase/poly-beta-1,6-N-acetylglucosamine synthase-like glycosyltransferase
MSIIISIIILISIDLYIILIIALSLGWFRLKETSVDPNIQNFNTFSIVIPFKNEEKNLKFLLSDLYQLNYSPSFYEIILVDDNSEDNSFEIVNKFIEFHELPWLIISSKGGKKKALEKAVDIAQSKYIISFDADCRIPFNILKAYNTALNKRKTKMISGPVTFYSDNKLWGKLLELEFISLIGSGAGSIGINKPIMLNAANLLFEKTLAIEAKKEIYNGSIESGDDIFLMHYTIEYYGAKEIQFLKNEDAIVRTPAPKNFKELVKQRIRWTAKARYYKINFTSISAIIILLFNLVFMVSFSFIFIAELRPIFLFIYLVKTLIDFPLLYSTSKFLKQEKRIILLPLLQVIYPFYIVIIAFAGLFSKEGWK